MGISSKLWAGGGEEIIHSRLRASHGSAAMASFSARARRRLRMMLARKSAVARAMVKAPMVLTMFQKLKP